MLARRCEAIGLEPINPHRFRHSWAHDLLAAGAQEGDVEKLAGWRTPTMVRRYGASAADQRARDAARRLGRGDRV
jgi:integrase